MYLLAFGSADHNVHLYDLRNTREPLSVIRGHGKAVSYVKWIGESEIVSASTDCSLRKWNMPPLRKVYSDEASSSAPLAPYLSEEGVFMPSFQGASPSASVGSRNDEGGSAWLDKVYTGHVNEKNFVGLSVDSTGDFITCGMCGSALFILLQEARTTLYTCTTSI